ncbi:MAG: hypothetical protein KGI24_03805 [Candidatus Omnitrophica bacterium]|nr:hypothetical protein [Candidatus Omnitrophota bacterium]
MKAVAVITVLLDTFCWFCGLIESSVKLLRGHGVSAPAAPPQPHIGLLVFFAVLFVMNIVTLVYLCKKDENPEAKKNGVDFKKIFLGIAWFAIIYFVVCFITGVIMGAWVGATAPSDLHNSISTATHDFFSKYGLLLLLGSALAAVLGTVKGWLPFTKE